MAAGERNETREVIADLVLAAACHEAAHAVAGILRGVPFVCAEIGPGGTAGWGFAMIAPSITPGPPFDFPAARNPGERMACGSAP